MYHKFLQYDSLNYVAKSFDVDEGENIEIKYKWFMFVWDEVELEHNGSYILTNAFKLSLDVTGQWSSG